MRRRLLPSLCLIAGLLLAGEALADLAVVVNLRSGVAVMTRNEVINLFFGRNRQFFNGLEVLPVDMPDSHPERVRFYAALVGKGLPEVNAYWARQMFSGHLQPLPRLNSAEEVLRHVANHPGGIGFVDATRVDARVRVVFELKE
jgi:hypothetical protein